MQKLKHYTYTNSLEEKKNNKNYRIKLNAWTLDSGTIFSYNRRFNIRDFNVQ